LTTTIRAYLDKVIVSGRIRTDLERTEMVAVQELYQLADEGGLEIVTSRESWREQERTRDPIVRAALQEGRGDVPVLQHDHRVLGFSHLQDQYGGFIANPPVTDIVDKRLFAHLGAAGLKDADARHLMYAVCNNCQRFVTLDRDFINNRTVLATLCRGVRIARPSELVAELSEPSP